MKLFNAMTMTMVFAYLPRLVKSFGTSEVDTGYFAGLIASNLYVGRTIFSLLWGYLADSKGKKFTLAISAVGLMISTLAFGFSYNFYWAFTTRFFQGSFMGIIVAGKAVLADACDDTNIAVGMSILISSFSLGLVVGPSVGGFLVFPVEKYPDTFSKGTLLEKFPILFANLVIVIGFLIGIPLVIFVLPKDKKKKVGEKSYLISSPMKRRYEEDNDVNVHNTLNSSNAYYNYSIETEEENKSFEENIDNIKIESFQLVEPYEKVLLNKRCNTIKERLKNFAFFKVFRIKECMLASSLYGIFSLVGIGFDELFPLYAATSIEYNGLGFSTSDIGIALAAVSVFLIFFQVTVLAKIVKRYGPIKSFVWCTMLPAFFFPVIPTVAAIHNKYLFWVCLVVIVLIIRICMAGSYITLNLLLNNSVDADLLGSANGLGMCLSSLGRAFAPTLFGSVFAWSLKNVKSVTANDDPIGFPCNQYFAFFALSLMSIIISIVASRLPVSMNYKKENADEHKDEENVSSKINENMMETGKITKLSATVLLPNTNL